MLRHRPDKDPRPDSSFERAYHKIDQAFDEAIEPAGGLIPNPKVRDFFTKSHRIESNGGSFTNLHTFAGGVSDGSRPLGGTLTLSGGTLYGTTVHGGTGSTIGTANDGVGFAINTDGRGYTNLVNFTGGTTNGANPYGSLTLVGTTLYGTTRIGGSANLGTIFSVNNDGTGFQTLFNFTGGATNGANPNGALTFAGSCLVGTTKAGGSANDGTVFKINLDGSNFRILHNFTGTDGINQDGDLITQQKPGMAAPLYMSFKFPFSFSKIFPQNTAQNTCCLLLFDVL